MIVPRMIGDLPLPPAWFGAGLAMALVLFILYREAFTVLPLHMDTGYYVPNRAILTRRLAPFDGWNVHFSGASRALPQLVHTALYLAFGSAGYARAFRLLYSLLCFVSGLFVYILAVELGGQGWQPTYAMGLYWVLTSESQYGTYFESAEAFQTVIELGGLILLIGGLQADLPWMTGLGLALFWIDTVFVKISAAASAGSLSLATLYLRPDLWLTTFALGAAAVAAYSLCLRRDPAEYAPLSGLPRTLLSPRLSLARSAIPGQDRLHRHARGPQSVHTRALRHWTVPRPR